MLGSSTFSRKGVEKYTFRSYISGIMNSRKSSPQQRPQYKTPLRVLKQPTTSLQVPQPFFNSYTWPPEEPKPTYERLFYSEDTYEQVVRGMVIPCADIMLHGVTETGEPCLYLSHRNNKPMRGWWHYGGRINIGETGLEAAIRHFKRDAGTIIPGERLEFIGGHDYFWHDRQQAPQNVPCHSKSETFALKPTAEELEAIRNKLGMPEYLPNTLQAMTWDRLCHSDIHPVLRDCYRSIFNRPDLTEPDLETLKTNNLLYRLNISAEVDKEQGRWNLASKADSGR